MPEAAGVWNHKRNVAQISTVSCDRFNTDFHSDTDDGEHLNAAIAQRDVQRCSFKRRYDDLVEWLRPAVDSSRESGETPAEKTKA